MSPRRQCRFPKGQPMTEGIRDKIVVVTGPSSRRLSQGLLLVVVVPADSFARAFAFAIRQPPEVDVNEILYHPTRQEL